MTRRSIPWFVVAGLLVATLSLRAPLATVPPVAPHIIVDLDVSAAAVGLLNTAPLVMFALFTPVAALIIRRAGPELTLLITLGGVLVGTLLRLLPGYGWLMAGMLVMGVFMTLGNIVVPVIIRRDIPAEHAAVATAGYVAMMNLGSLATTLGTAPLAELVGWSPAMAACVIFTIAGIVLWSAHMVRGSARATSPPALMARDERDEAAVISEGITGPVPIVQERTLKRLLRRPLLWLLLLAYCIHTAVFFVFAAWLPVMLVDLIAVDLPTAGALSSIFHGVAAIGPFLVPVLLRTAGPVVTAAVIGCCWVMLVVGTMWAPGMFWIWGAVGAVAHSGSFVVIFTAVVRTTRSDAEAATMSALIQGAGFLVGTIGAPLAGLSYESSGSWTATLVGALAAAGVYTVALVLAARLWRRDRLPPRSA